MCSCIIFIRVYFYVTPYSYTSLIPPLFNTTSTSQLTLIPYTIYTLPPEFHLMAAVYGPGGRPSRRGSAYDTQGRYDYR